MEEFVMDVDGEIMEVVVMRMRVEIEREVEEN